MARFDADRTADRLAAACRAAVAATTRSSRWSAGRAPSTARSRSGSTSPQSRCAPTPATSPRCCAAASRRSRSAWSTSWMLPSSRSRTCSSARRRSAPAARSFPRGTAEVIATAHSRSAATWLDRWRRPRAPPPLVRSRRSRRASRPRPTIDDVDRMRSRSRVALEHFDRVAGHAASCRATEADAQSRRARRARSCCAGSWTAVPSDVDDAVVGARRRGRRRCGPRTAAAGSGAAAPASAGTARADPIASVTKPGTMSSTPATEHEHAVDSSSPGTRPAWSCACSRRSTMKPSCFVEPRADDRRQDEQRDRVEAADRVRDLDDHVDLDHRHDDHERRNEREHPATLTEGRPGRDSGLLRVVDLVGRGAWMSTCTP